MVLLRLGGFHVLLRISEKRTDPLDSSLLIKFLNSDGVSTKYILDNIQCEYESVNMYFYKIV